MPSALFRYVALGDSTGVGVGAAHDGGYPERLYRRLKAANVPAGILNLAQSGAKTADVLSRQVNKAVAARPALITLGIGSNDLWRMVPAQTFASNLTAIANHLEQSGARVIVSTLFDLTLAPIASMVQGMLGISLSSVGERIHDFNQHLFALARRPGFEVVDLYSPTHREKQRVGELFSADGFHPSAAGYDQWAHTLWPRVEAVAKAWPGAEPQLRGA